jgi:hypothetical protein
VVRQAATAVDAGDVDDDRVAGPTEGGEGAPQAEEGTLDVQVEHLVVPLLVRLGDGQGAGDAGVVDEDVEAVPSLDCGVDDRLAGRDRPQVAADGKRLAARSRDPADRLLGALAERA